MKTNKTVLIIVAVIIVFAVVMVLVKMHQNALDQRTGTQQLSAEQVVDLEVQADAQNNQ